MLREVLFQNDLSHYKCERLIEFYSKSVRMTNFTFFFCFFFFYVSLSDGNVFSNEIDVDFYRDVEWN